MIEARVLEENLRQLRDRAAPLGAFMQLIAEARRAGAFELAYAASTDLVARGASVRTMEDLALDLGRHRYLAEGVAWVEGAPEVPPRQAQLVGALRTAVERGALADVDALRRSLPVAVRRWALHDYLDGGRDLERAATHPIAVDDLDLAVRICEEDTAAPHGLLWQLASMDRVSTALRLADTFVAEVLGPLAIESPGDPELSWPFPIQAIVLGLAHADRFEQALALAKERLAETPFRGRSIEAVGCAYVDRRGPAGVEMFVDSFSRKELTQKAGLLGHVARWHALRGSPAVVAEVPALKGIIQFCVQVGGFFGYLRGGHLDLAEKLLSFADSGQKAGQRGALAGAWAKRGDVERALDTAKSIRGPDRDFALLGIVEALIANGSTKAAMDFTREHVRSPALVDTLAKRFAKGG